MWLPAIAEGQRLGAEALQRRDKTDVDRLGTGNVLQLPPAKPHPGLSICAVPSLGDTTAVTSAAKAAPATKTRTAPAAAKDRRDDGDTSVPVIPCGYITPKLLLAI